MDDLLQQKIKYCRVFLLTKKQCPQIYKHNIQTLTQILEVFTFQKQKKPQQKNTPSDPQFIYLDIYIHIYIYIYTSISHKMSVSENQNVRSMISVDDQNYLVQKQDDAQFFSIAQEYNQRRAKMTNYRAMEAMNMYHNFNIKNNPKDPKNGDVKEQKTRKTRNDQQGREFICGACKGGYLSYPALYTHIKTKHGGVAPEGTIRGKNNNNKRRGRPKTLRKQPNLYHRNQPQFQFPAEYCNIVPKMELTFISQDEEDNNQMGDEDQEADIAAIQSQMFKNQTKQLKNLNKKNLKGGLGSQIKAVPISTLPISKVMAIFLHNIQQILKKKTADMMTVQNVLVRLVEFVNENYDKILKDFQQISQYYVRRVIPANVKYCSYEKCDYIPVFVDKFFQKLDREDDQLEIDFLSDFCQWLREKKLTYIRLIKPEIFEVGEAEEEDD